MKYRAESLEVTPRPILIVEDEAAVLRLLVRLLKPLDRELLTAGSAEEALALLDKREVAVILADQQLPGLRGADLLKHARSSHPDTVRLMITGESDPATAIQAINRAEVYRFVSKPWNNDELLATVRNALALHDLRRKNALYEAAIQRQNAELLDLNRTLESRVEERTTEVVEKARQIETLYVELEESFDATMRALLCTLRLSHTILMDHSQRTAGRVANFANELGLDADLTKHLGRAAMLHWLGLISAPHSLFEKEPRDFDHNEKAIWEFHPTLGYQAIEHVPVLKTPARIIRHYLEPWNTVAEHTGNRRPVMRAAQILALASSFEWRRRQPRNDDDAFLLAEDGLARLEAGRGTRFSPELLDAFTEQIRREVFGVARREVEVDHEMLQPGMVLARTIDAKIGRPIATRGMVLTHEIIARLRAEAGVAGGNAVYVWHD